MKRSKHIDDEKCVSILWKKLAWCTNYQHQRFCCEIFSVTQYEGKSKGPRNFRKEMSGVYEITIKGMVPVLDGPDTLIVV